MDNPHLSVLLVCYNQKNFLPQALESILMQKTSFEFEIVVADDASTDGSQQILEHYAAKHPKIRILSSSENLGVTKNYKRGFAACLGNYIAVLEGDDYWVKEDRLQIMVNFLDANPVFSMAANRFLGLRENGTYFWHPLPKNDEHPLYLSVNELIYIPNVNIINIIGNFSTCIYRKAALDTIPLKLFEYNVVDWHINVAVSQYGPVAYFPELFSVYRLFENSTWNRLTAKEQEKSIIDGANLIEEYFPQYKEQCALAKSYFYVPFTKKCLRWWKRKLKVLLQL